jgi:hypothetical protein
MSYVQITADFPGIRTDEMNEISNRLEKGQWKKLHDHHGTMNTAWLATFAEEVPNQEAIKNAQDTFMACCSPYCRPLMVLQCIHNEPKHADTK